MKITVERSDSSNTTFPQLFQHEKTIMLALNDRKGLVPDALDKVRIGTIEDGLIKFSTDYWQPFKGTVTLQND